MDDTKPESASKSQGSHASAPIAANGTADGSKPEAHVLGLADSLPETHCPNCQKFVVPKGKGQCPTCGRVLKMSFLARKHPVNKLRVEQHLKELLAEFRPLSSTDRCNCELLAAARERIELTKPGTPEWDRLATRIQQLSTALEESRRARAERTTDAKLEHLTVDQIISKLENMLGYARETKALSERIDQPAPSPPDTAGASDEAAAEPSAVEDPQPTPAPVLTQKEPIESPEERERRALEIRRRLGWTKVHDESTSRRFDEGGW